MQICTCRELLLVVCSATVQTTSLDKHWLYRPFSTKQPRWKSFPQALCAAIWLRHYKTVKCLERLLLKSFAPKMWWSLISPVLPFQGTHLRCFMNKQRYGCCVCTSKRAGGYSVTYHSQQKRRDRESPETGEWGEEEDREPAELKALRPFSLRRRRMKGRMTKGFMVIRDRDTVNKSLFTKC